MTLPHFVAGTVTVDQLNDLVDAINDINFDTGYEAGLIVPAGSGGVITAPTTRQCGNVAMIRASQVIATAITVPADGDVGNIQIAQVTDSTLWPTRTQPLMAFSGGPVGAFYINISGQIQITAIAPGASLAVGATVSYGGLYLLG